MAKKQRSTAKMSGTVTRRTTTHDGLLDGRTEFEVQSVHELFSREEGEEYVPSMLESMAADFSKDTGVAITTERIVIAAVHLLLFGDDGAHRNEFLADSTARKFRTDTEEEEEIDNVLFRLDPDTARTPGDIRRMFEGGSGL